MRHRRARGADVSDLVSSRLSLYLRCLEQPDRDGVATISSLRLADVVRREEVQIAVVAVPAEAAQGVVEEAAKAGIPAILNFAPVQLRVPPQVRLRNVDLKTQLENLAFRLARRHPAQARSAS